jgi:hypothetical protein
VKKRGRTAGNDANCRYRPLNVKTPQVPFRFFLCGLINLRALDCAAPGSKSRARGSSHGSIESLKNGSGKRLSMGPVISPGMKAEARGPPDKSGPRPRRVRHREKDSKLLHRGRIPANLQTPLTAGYKFLLPSPGD